MSINPMSVGGAPLQQVQEYGGTTPKQINLQPYTLKPRRRNAIPIINLDTGDEVKVNSGSGEAQQISNLPVGGTPALMTSSLSASTTTVYQESQEAEKPVQAVKQVSKHPAEETKTIPPSEGMRTMHATVTKVY